MLFITICAFTLLSLTFLSLWIRRDPKVWGALLALSLFAGWMGGHILWDGLIFLVGWVTLWIVYICKHRFRAKVGLFMLLVFLSFGFKLHFFPGFVAWMITSKFGLGFDSPLVGLFPLALLVPLALDSKDWKKALLSGLCLSCIGIGLVISIALAVGVTKWHFKIPSYPAIRYFSHLVFIAVPEEGFYRGFVQKELSSFLSGYKGGKWVALVLSSLIFTLAHLYWSPDLAILAFAFVAGLLYGSVYLISKKIESAILCHFLFNVIHMTFFTYHAM